MPKESIKDKLEGKELDLSLSSLTTVPVKEIATLPKATHLDLSCNQITLLPDNFCILTNIVKLDLSKNNLTELPADMGSLSKLQHLDVYCNQLRMLPVSFWQLKNLKWLDLKDNPLDETLRSIAGDCLNDMQCRKCAKQVLLYMKSLQSEHERQRQKRLQEQRAIEASKKAEEEQEKQRRKAEKQKEKELRRQKYEAERLEKQQTQESPDQQDVEESKVSENGTKVVIQDNKETVGLSCCGVFLTMLIGLFAILVGLYFYCETNLKDPVCIHGKSTVDHYYASVRQIIDKYTADRR